MRKRLYNINELASILGFTVPAIHAQLARKNFDAVPPPIKLGRRLAWPEEIVEDWLAQKIAAASSAGGSPVMSVRPRGRPRKIENR
jgi:predicted DNA-binding transcriptional regulator AlpA